MLGQRETRPADVAQAVRPEPAQVDQPGDRQERLVGRDVRGRLLAPDVLLARLQRQHEAAPAVVIVGLADDPPRQLADVLRARGQEAIVGAAVGDVVSGRLALADRKRAPVRARRLEHAQRHQVDMGDGQRPGARGGRRQLGSGLEAAEEVGLREDRARGALTGGREPVGIGGAAGVRHLDHLHAEAGRERAHHLARLRVERLGDHHPPAPGRLLRDVAGVGGDRGAVVAGRVGDVHPGQLADRGLVLEDRLQRPLAHLRLVRRVCGQELAPLHDGVHHGGHVVVVDARAEKRELAAGVDIAPGKLGQVRPQLGLGQRRIDPQRPVEAHAGGDLGEELGDRADSDRVQHHLQVRLGQRREGHSDSSSSR